MITAIVPLRLSPNSLYDEIERIERIAQEIPEEKFCLLIVDYGTCEARSGEIQELKKRYPDIKIVRERDYGAFNIGRARDIGVQNSETEIVMLHDIDFLCSKATYEKIYNEAVLRNLSTQGYDFFTVPTIFLTDRGTDKYLKEFSDNSEIADWLVHYKTLRGDFLFFRHIAFGSSALVINRYFYLVAGGHDPAFDGHGAEDFEFYHRLENLCQRAPKSNKYYENIPYSPGEFQGFRAFFALFGQDIFMRGICMVHLDHPRREKADKTYHKTSRNFALLRRRMEEFDSGLNVVPPLKDPRVDQKTLLLVDPLSKLAKALRYILPALGDFQFLPESAFGGPKELLEFIEREKISQTLFLNPFGNEDRELCYHELRSHGLSVIAFDRGALPDSWFFDRHGFLASSTVYSRQKWDYSLGAQNLEAVRDFVSSMRDDNKHLEQNDASMGAAYWRNRLGLGQRKVIFVAFQRPQDVATRFFGGSVGSYSNFVSWISDLVSALDPAQYVVVAKVHPLETEVPDIDGIVWSPFGANIHDLIDLCEKMVVINSGSGLIAAAFGKPVLVCGDAFYAHSGICWSAHCIEQLIELCYQDLVVESETVDRFLYYLISQVYSFGDSFYTEIGSDNSTKKIVNRIDFSVIRGVAKSEIILGKRLKRLPNESFLLKSAGRKITTESKRLSSSRRQEEFLDGGIVFSGFQRVVWSFYKFLSGPFQGERSRRKMEEHPIEFLVHAQHPANRLIGKMLLPR